MCLRSAMSRCCTLRKILPRQDRNPHPAYRRFSEPKVRASYIASGGSPTAKLCSFRAFEPRKRRRWGHPFFDARPCPASTRHAGHVRREWQSCFVAGCRASSWIPSLGPRRDAPLLARRHRRPAGRRPSMRPRESDQFGSGHLKDRVTVSTNSERLTRADRTNVSTRRGLLPAQPGAGPEGGRTPALQGQHQP